MLMAPKRQRAKKGRVAAIRIVFNDTTLKMECYVSLCNERGDFPCHGIWSNKQCPYNNHVINPYTSRKNVIIFQMWNLNHQIEI